METPLKLQMDKGKEFYNFHVHELLWKNIMHHFSIKQDMESQTVELVSGKVQQSSAFQYLSLFINFRGHGKWEDGAQTAETVKNVFTTSAIL